MPKGIQFSPSFMFGYAVANGLMLNMKSVAVFGRSKTLSPDTLTDITLIPGVTTYTFPSNAGQTMEIVSSNAADTAVVMLVEGLDSDFDLQSETVTLNGTTAVALSKEYARINRIGNVGTVAHVGNVSLQATGGGEVFSYAEARAQESNVGVYTAPRGYTVSIWQIIQSMQKSIGSNADLTIGVKYRASRNSGESPNGVFRIPFDSGIQRNGDSATEFFNVIPERIEGPVDLKLFATAQGAGTVAAARMSLILDKSDNSG